MPVIEKSSYTGAPFWQFNGHLQTIVPGLLRRVDGVTYSRERIHTPDEDFLDLDWIRQGNDRLLLLTHGLEGSSDRQYMRGMAKLFSTHDWDVLAWNCRSCSGSMNRAFRLYHHGDSDDIAHVIAHALATHPYQRVVLVGFSMGGNITMKYLGTRGEDVPPQVRGGVAFSAPCALESASMVLDRWDNAIYRQRFLKALEIKLREKDRHYPGRLDLDKLRHIRQWRDFDEWFSAPICNYRDADEFYYQSSARNFIGGIRRPTLLVNALNDPILTLACMPYDLAAASAYFFLETPAEGGHCGFMAKGKDAYAWSERRALAFLENC